MDDYLIEFQSKFLIGFLLFFSNYFIYLARMSETAQQQTDQENELEFDCPNSFDFKDPNDDDLNLNYLFGMYFYSNSL